MYCKKCGTQISDIGRFCPKCGTSVTEKKSDWTENRLASGKQVFAGIGNKKGMFIGSAAAVAAALILLATFVMRPHLVDEPCDHCNHSPSIAYETSDGSMAYVCRECSKECMLCGKKATKHYENLLGTIVFVCDDCYSEVAGD